MCVESEIRGDITIGEPFYFDTYLLRLYSNHHNCTKMYFFALSGARTVVHPKARIIAEAGPIIIGEGNLIEEQVLIINR